MRTKKLVELLNARIISGDLDGDLKIEEAFASDLMSDVLTLDHSNPLLITGLANMQTIRTAEMADISVIVLARGKKAPPEMVELAQQNGITLLETPFSVFKTSGILFANGIKPVY
ncbi:MAG: DRTGG domain-containing protein [Bacteroidales bacterium]